MHRKRIHPGLWCVGFLWALATAGAHAQTFGFNQVDNRIVVDTGAHLRFSVDTRNGDIVSMNYRDNELQTPGGNGSQLASGLGSAQVSARMVGNVVVVSAKSRAVVQYYIAAKGRDALYMATYAPALLPVGELRFVTRLNVAKLPDAQQEPDSNVGQAIEAHDVFLLPDGRTSSKFYSARRMLDDAMHGVSGPGVAVYMLMGNREHSAGGPFFKDIATQKTVVTHELYNYMFSNHTQTEPYRGGLHGVYGLLFTDGAAPAPDLTDLGFVDDSLGLLGFLGSAGRGAVAGRVSGVAASQPAVVGLGNADAQYWSTATPGGDFRIAGVRPGQYRITLYENEREVAQDTLEVHAGVTEQAALTAAPPIGPVQWQIGALDGTTAGFRNASLVQHAHPSDARMAPWQTPVFTVGTSPDGDFPAAQWRDVNAPVQIAFALAPGEVRDYTLRMYISLAKGQGRPQVTVNDRWTAPVPAPSIQPDSRGVTRGTYRGNNTVFTVAIPAQALQAGTNALAIGVASGNATTGFLGPCIVWDSLQLVPAPDPDPAWRRPAAPSAPAHRGLRPRACEHAASSQTCHAPEF
ncbi:rhamnogalacturonan lyase B N-terminal domain-containing protein [Sphingomonas sp. NCPPB 2930]